MNVSSNKKKKSVENLCNFKRYLKKDTYTHTHIKKRCNEKYKIQKRCHEKLLRYLNASKMREHTNRFIVKKAN